MALTSVLLLLAMATGCGSEPSAAEYLERARIHESEGELQAALIETRNAVQADGENHDARLLLGMLQLRTGDAAGAEKEIRRAAELGAEAATTRPALARALQLQSKFDELRELDGEGLTGQSEAVVLANRAYAHLATGDTSAARADAERALELDPSSPESPLVLAWVDALADDFNGARARLDQTLDAAPQNVAGWELLGDVEWSAGRPEDAIAAYGEAVERSDRAFSARLKRAEVRLELGKREAALADLDALSEAGIELPAIDLARGRIDLQNGELLDAQIHFERALKETPDHPPALGNLALTHLVLGNVEQAEQYGKQMMAATNDSNEARRLLGAIRLENGHHALAMETVEPVLRGAGSGDPFVSRLISTALLREDRHDEAIEQMLVAAASLPPEDGESVNVPASPLVLARTPSEELLEEITGSSATAAARDAGRDFLDQDDRTIARVLELLGRDRNDEALQTAETLLTAMPGSAVPHNLIGRVHFAGGREAASRAAFEQALDTDAQNATALRALAELERRAGNLDASRARLEQVLLGDGDTETALLSLAQLDAQAGNESAMLERLEQARIEHPDSAAPVLSIASYHAARAEHEQVLEALGALDDTQREQPSALQMEGSSLLALRRFDEAFERFDALVERQTNQPQWYYLRAQASAGLENGDALLRDLETALELAPNHVPSLIAMTNLETLRDNFDVAEAHIDRLRDLIPGRPELDAVVANLAERKGAGAADNDTAENGPKTLRIETSQAALAAARELYESGDPDQATALLATWLEANPQDIRVRLTLANTYGRLDRTDEAIAEYETLLENDGAALSDQVRLATLNNLAWYLREKDAARAVAYAERALEVEPESVATLDTLAMIHFEQGDNDEAKAAFDRAVAIGIDDPSVRFHGARIEAALGNDDAARALLEPLLEEGTEFPEAADAATLLEEVRQSGN